MARTTKADIAADLTKRTARAEAGEVESINIRRAENGYTCNVYRKPAKEDKGDICCSSSKDMVFQDIDGLKAYLDDVIG